MKKAIICDLDGTLVNNPNWNGELATFYDHILEGQTIGWCYELIKILAKHYKIIFLTARNEKCRDKTEIQLDNLFSFDYELYMRKPDDTRFDFLIKEEFVKMLQQKYEILFCLDDNMRNCIMFKKYIPALLII